MNGFDFKSEDEQLLTQEERYLQFGLGDEKYAIYLLSVKEVIPVPEMTNLPNSPKYYKGIMNLRGQIISVVDLRTKLGVFPRKDNDEEAVVIVEIEGISIGVIVDSIDKVLNINIDDIAEVPEVNSQINAKFIEGIYQHDNALTVLLDLKSILNIEEIKKMNKAAA